ncbi:MAG: flavin-dependent monooxygenase [Oceanospirillales bacterium]|uniref:Alkylation response protein AidB-like acyl-CoA dehydrogenase n=1 Tax=Marinobacterium halophilum TaxID=267374 RepID=A0A2P8ETX6_9GAMM|nr:acyl-CoA dehydrogenase family protein [Marinobacterium halophilum]MBR9829493.1 flavin-dependent monooxygenase [Oceanospirillales bacterium]PSL12913.1 alkylation response protein AidB-like acyl-CoA dehydrogenase [Marinobacterium halophilum]
MPGYQIDKSLWGGEAVFNALLDDVRTRRHEFEDQKYISQDIIESFKHIGVYRAMVPKAMGGDERSPMEFLQMVESLAAADGSAGWVASFGMNPAYLAALPSETINKIWSETPNVVFAGGIFPTQPAKKVEGGFIVNGCWKFGSGCMGASLIGVGIQPDGGEPLPRMAVMPANKVKIKPNWDVIGMVGTGSHDLVVEDVFVPEEWTFVRGGKPNIESDFFRYPSLSFAAQVLAVTTAGLAREALDVVQAMAAGRKSVTGAPNLGEREYVQIEIAKAEAKVRSSRAFFYEATEAAWSTIKQGGEPSRDQVNLVRLATTNLAHECAEAIRSTYQVTGMTGAYNDHPLSRILRDSMMCTQHAFMGAITLKNAGAMFFGHDPLPGYL